MKQYMIINGFLRFVDQPFAHILCMFTIFTHYFSLSSVAVQYIYRYLLICRSMKMTYKIYVLLLIFPFVMSSINMSHAYFIYIPPPGNEQTVAEDLNADFLESGETSVRIGSVMDTTNPRTFISLIISCNTYISYLK